MKKISDDELKKQLTPEQYHSLREKGTEAPFIGKYFQHKEDGTYTCGACSAELFRSDAKYESDIPCLAGWPSFSDVASSDSVKLVNDNSFGMRRLEVVCKNCDSHLGHPFDDNESVTGQHYCINSASLNFKKKD